MATELVLILVLLAALLWPSRARTAPRRERWKTGCLLVLAAVAALNYFYLSRAGGFLHRWDLFHTLIGARYFPELGYDKLYECAIFFDRRTHHHYGELGRIRDLSTLRYVPVERALRDSDCAERFTPARAQRFVADLAAFDALIPPSRWASLFQDKGYNGSPFYTFVVSRLTGGIDFDRRSLLLLALVDVVLILAAFAVAARAFGLRTALVAFVFFCVSFPNRYIHMGGSFLRFDFFACLLIGLSLLRMSRHRAAAALLALAAMI
ncbi:MAG: hypothetical protein ACREQ9_18540, partial [Candidatus Binatia bacterium]